MCTYAHAAFWVSVVASTALMVGYVIPFWLSQVIDSQNKTYWGLWYRVVCSSGNCSTVADALDGDFADIPGDWSFELLIIPILSSIGFGLTFLAITLLEIVNCRCCGPRCNPHGIIAICAVFFLVSALVITADVILCIIGLDTLFSGKQLENAEEFPWSVCLFIIGGIFDYIAAGMYIAISCNWERYALDFGYRSAWYGRYDEDSVRGRYNKRSKLRNSQSTTYSASGRSLKDNVFTTFGKYDRSDLRQSSNSKRDLRASRTSAKDSPPASRFSPFNSSIRDDDDVFFNFRTFYGSNTGENERKDLRSSSNGQKDTRDLRYSKDLRSSHRSTAANDYANMNTSVSRGEDTSRDHRASSGSGKMYRPKSWSQRF